MQERFILCDDSRKRVILKRYLGGKNKMLPTIAWFFHIMNFSHKILQFWRIELIAIDMKYYQAVILTRMLHKFGLGMFMH